MTRDRFDETYDRLQDASNRHAEIDKDPERWDELRRSRAELDAARSENTAARRSIVRRRDYATPDQVQPGLGIEGGMSSRTRLMAGLGAVVFLASVIAVAWLAVQTVDQPVYLDGDVVESLVTEPRCQWVLQIPLTNDTDEAITIERGEITVDQGPHRLITPPVEIGAGQSMTIAATVNLTTCPTSVDDIDHQSMRLTWTSESEPAQEAKLRF